MSQLRLIHASDFHLGVKRPGHLRADRFSDFAENMHAIAREAIRRNVDLVIIAGDVFHSPRPSNKALYEFARFLNTLITKGIHVVVVRGNHDASTVITRRGVLDAFEEIASTKTSSAKCFHYMPRIGSRIIYTNSGSRIRVVSLPYIKPVAKAGEDIVEAIEETKRQALEAVAREAEKGGDEDFKILVAHVTLAGASLGSERIFASHMLEPRFELDELSKMGFDYIALGHVHKWQKWQLAGGIYACYSGSIERVDFSEADEEKGFIFIEGTEGGFKPRFLKLDVRPMVRKKMSLRDKGPLYVNSLLSSLKGLTGALVKLIVEVDEESRTRFEASRVVEVARRLGVFDIYIDVIVRERSILASIQSRLYKSVIEAFVDYIKAQRLRPDFEKRVIETGLKLLEEYLRG